MTLEDYRVCACIGGIIWIVIAYIRIRRRDDRIYGKGWRKRAKREHEEWLRKLHSD